MDIDELVHNILDVSAKCLTSDLSRKSLTVEEASQKIKQLIEDHDQKLMKGYIQLLPDNQKNLVNLANELMKPRYGLGGIYEDFPNDCKERSDAERDYWKSVVSSIMTKVSKVIDENEKNIKQIEDNSKESL